MTYEFDPRLDLDSERLARDYDEVSATRQFESGKDLLAPLGIAPAERVLDVGCGTGLLARHLADLVGPAGMVRLIWCFSRDDAIPMLPHHRLAGSIRAPQWWYMRVWQMVRLS